MCAGARIGSAIVRTTGVGCRTGVGWCARIGMRASVAPCAGVRYWTTMIVVADICNRTLVAARASIRFIVAAIRRITFIVRRHGLGPCIGREPPADKDAASHRGAGKFDNEVSPRAAFTGLIFSRRRFVFVLVRIHLNAS